MTTDVQNRSESPAGRHPRPGAVQGLLAALGLLPRGDLLPALSGWRGRRRPRSA